MKRAPPAPTTVGGSLASEGVPPTPTRLLVIYPGALGDTLLALPVITALKQRYELATLELIGHPSLAEVLPGRSVVDRVRSIDGPEFHGLLGDALRMPSSVKAFFANFHMTVAWVNDRDGQLRQALTSLGVRHVVVQSPWLLRAGSRHATERFAETLEGLDTPWEGASPQKASLPHPLSQALPTMCLTPTDADLKAGREWLKQERIDASATALVAIHPGSGSPSKCWPVDRYAEVISRLHSIGTEVVVIEGPADAEVVRALDRILAPAQLPRLSGVGLAAVVELLSQCRVFLGNDSGLTQMAAGLGIPTVCLFGPTDPAIWAPRGDHVVPIRGESCCQCPTREEQSRCVSRACLSIPPRRVLNALRRAGLESRRTLPRDSALC